VRLCLALLVLYLLLNLYLFAVLLQLMVPQLCALLLLLRLLYEALLLLL